MAGLDRRRSRERPILPHCRGKFGPRQTFNVDVASFFGIGRVNAAVLAIRLRVYAWLRQNYFLNNFRMSLHSPLVMPSAL